MKKYNNKIGEKNSKNLWEFIEITAIIDNILNENRIALLKASGIAVSMLSTSLLNLIVKFDYFNHNLLIINKIKF
jgi:hypothetical protein